MSIKCNCGCKEPCQPLNSSNRSMIIPVAGSSAYEEWLSYNPDLDPNLNPESPWVESYWIENYVGGTPSPQTDDDIFN